MNRQYIGARYTIKVYTNSITPSSADWEANVSYEAITLVTFGGDSYLSKKPVPSNIGDPASNPDYWVLVGNTTAQIVTLQNQVADILSNLGNYVTPDDFTGTDTGKLQAAFDSLAANGGTIVLNRKYTLNGNITISHDSQNNEEWINVVGLGKDAGIDFNSYSIIGADQLSRTWGGLHFANCRFIGTGKAFQTDYLIRLWFEGCTFENFDYVTYGGYGLGGNSSQTLFFIGCQIRKIAVSVCYGTNNNWDTHFIGCSIEACTNLIDSGNVKGLFINSNLIEGVYDDNYTNKKIVINGEYHNVVIDSNYFEDNICLLDLTNGADLDLCKLTFSNNVSWEHKSNINLIVLPGSVANAEIIMSNNDISMGGYASAYGIYVTNTASSYAGVKIYNTINANCPVYDPTYKIPEIEAISKTVSYTALKNVTMSPDVSSRIFAAHRVRQASLMFTLNENVSSGDPIFSFGSEYDAPDRNTIFTAKVIDSNNIVTAEYWAEITDDAKIYVRHALSSGDVIMLDTTWIAK